MDFAKILKSLIDLSQIKAKDVAEKLNYHSSYISKWIHGKNLPNLSNDPDILHRLSEILGKGIYINDSEGELTKFTERKVPVYSEKLTILFVFSILQDGYYTSYFKDHEVFPEESGVVIGLEEIMDKCFSFINGIIVNAPHSVNLYSNLNVNRSLGKHNDSLNRFYTTRSVELNYHYITSENINKFNHDLFQLVDRWVLRSQFINTYIYTPAVFNHCHFLYIKDYVCMFFVLDDHERPLMMSYTTSKKIMNEMESNIVHNFIEKNIILGAREGDTVEADVFSSSLVPGNEFLFHMSSLETFFLSESLLRDIMNKMIVTDEKIRIALWTQKIARQIATSFPLTVSYMKDSLNKSFMNRQILLGTRFYQLTESEMGRLIHDYIEFIKNARDVRFFISPGALLPHTHGNTDMSYFLDHNNIIYKRSPEFTDAFTKHFMVASNTQANRQLFDMSMSRLESSDALEYSKDQFIALLENYKALYKS